jgi:hypothetical protein
VKDLRILGCFDRGLTFYVDMGEHRKPGSPTIAFSPEAAKEVSDLLSRLAELVEGGSPGAGIRGAGDPPLPSMTS